MTNKELINATGLMQISIANMFEISIDIVNNWSRNRTIMPPDVVAVLKEIVESNKKIVDRYIGRVKRVQ